MKDFEEKKSLSGVVCFETYHVFINIDPFGQCLCMKDFEEKKSSSRVDCFETYHVFINIDPFKLCRIQVTVTLYDNCYSLGSLCIFTTKFAYIRKRDRKLLRIV